VRRDIRRAREELMRRFAAAAVLALAAASPAAAETTPAPAPTPLRINVEKLQPRSIFPKRKLHVELIVEVNKLGQVTRVRSIKPSHDPQFDAHTYGNALQAFIRTTDGQVVLGTYRLTYDYDPATLRVRRDVALVRPGGVDPNAEGAVTQMMAVARRHAAKVAARTAAAASHATPTQNSRLPDLPQVMATPAH
jgi:hypothetical protein